VSGSGTARPPVAILCGGRGTRLQEHTRAIPKPMVEIGGMPIVWHVVQLYAAQGFRRFLLATGYRSESIEEFVAAHRWPDGVSVECVNTGLDTQTGARIKRLQSHLAGEERFCATYADGVADIDLEALLAFHEGHGALATMTVVRPELQFGVTELQDDGRVVGFHEKPRSEHWINGGFFCFQRQVLDYLAEDSVLERAPLERLAAEGLRASGAAPWRLDGGGLASLSGERAGSEQHDGLAHAAQPPLAGKGPSEGLRGGVAHAALRQ
jgi:glucose-1-phosphate cytidylyltransferase